MQFMELAIFFVSISALKYVDVENFQNVLIIRFLYGAQAVLCLCLLLYTYFKINAENNKKIIKIPADIKNFTPSENSEMNEVSIRDYDYQQLKKAATQVVMGVLIVSFIHYKWNIIQPLFLQIIMSPMQLLRSPLLKVYLFNEKIDRPFVEESPFGNLLKSLQPPEPQANSSPSTKSTSTKKIPKEKDSQLPSSSSSTVTKRKKATKEKTEQKGEKETEKETQEEEEEEMENRIEEITDEEEEKKG